MSPLLMQVSGSTLRYPSLLYRTKNGVYEKVLDLYQTTVNVRQRKEISPRWNLKTVGFLQPGKLPSAICPVLLITPNLQFNGLNDRCQVITEYRRNIMSQLSIFGLRDVKENSFYEFRLESMSTEHLRAGLKQAINTPGPGRAIRRLCSCCSRRKISELTSHSRRSRIKNLGSIQSASRKLPTSKQRNKSLVRRRKVHSWATHHGLSMRLVNTSAIS